jgi:hypothetical protein
MTRAIGMLLLALGLFLLSARAQTKAEKGKVIIDAAIAALGGEQFLALRNKMEKGRAYSFYQEKLSGLSKANVYTRYLTAPTAPNPKELYMRERQSFGDNESWSVLFDEEDGWEITFRGARPLKKDAVERFRDNRQRDIFYILLRRLNEEGLIIEYRGAEVVENREVESVDITDSLNRVVTVSFARSTGLPFRQVFSRRDELRIPHEEVALFDKYRDVGGVKLPLVTQRYRDGERNYAMFADQILVNQDLTDEKFALPGNVKMLEREKPQ